MAYTEEQLSALESALAKGEKRVSFADKTIEYRRIEELVEAIAQVKRALLEQAVNTGLWPRPPRQIRVQTRKAT